MAPQVTSIKPFESKGFDCDFCPVSYKHKSSKTKHVKKFHTETQSQTGILSRDDSIEKHLSCEMEVLEEAGLMTDVLDLDPMEETMHTVNNRDKVQMDANDIAQFAIESVLNIVQSQVPLLPTTIAPAVLACPGAASFFLLNPEQPIIDLTSSQRSLVIPPLVDMEDYLNETVEEVEADLDEFVAQLEIQKDLGFKCEVCSKSLSTKGELVRHIEKHQEQNFQTMDNYSCQECELDYSSREEFKEHMFNEHIEETEDDHFEVSQIKSWTNFENPSENWYDPMPPSVESRRAEAIRGKEAKEAAKEAAMEAANEQCPALEMEQEQLTHSFPASLLTHPPSAPQVGGPARPGLAQ